MSSIALTQIVTNALRKKVGKFNSGKQACGTTLKTRFSGFFLREKKLYVFCKITKDHKRRHFH